MEAVTSAINLPFSDPLLNRLILQASMTMAILLFLAYSDKKLPDYPINLSYKDKLWTLGLKGQKRLIKLLGLLLNLWTSFFLLDELLPEEGYKLWRLLLIGLNLVIFYYLPKNQSKEM